MSYRSYDDVLEFLNGFGHYGYDSTEDFLLVKEEELEQLMYMTYEYLKVLKLNSENFTK